MRQLEKVSSIITPLPRIDIDTDQIIPKQFLKLVKSTGYGDYLFHGWRYDQDGKTKVSEFVINNPKYAGSHILVTGDNFGCGSSREHAVWALRDYGFDVVIAPSFADIFASNCTKSGVLAAALPQSAVDKLLTTESIVDVDVRARSVGIRDSQDSWNFQMGDHAQRMLLEGLDEIGLTLEIAEKIESFEKKRVLSS